jgi:hypothetical protein
MGMETMDQCLTRLMHRGWIIFEEVCFYVEDKVVFDEFVW